MTRYAICNITMDDDLFEAGDLVEISPPRKSETGTEFIRVQKRFGELTYTTTILRPTDITEISKEVADIMRNSYES